MKVWHGTAMIGKRGNGPYGTDAMYGNRMMKGYRMNQWAIAKGKVDL